MQEQTEWEDDEIMNEEGHQSLARVARPVPWRIGVGFALVFVIGFVGGTYFGTHGGGRVVSALPVVGDSLDATPDPSVDMSDFWKVWNELNAQYVVTHASSTLPSSKERMWGAIQGLTSAYGDPYTVFFPPEQSKQFKDSISGSFTGVGMELGVNDSKQLTVIAPLKGTPADKAGILSGDQIVTIDGKATDGLSTDEAVTMIRGPKGTTVDFGLMRKGTPIDIKVVRDTIQVPEIVYSQDAKTGVYTIALYEFTENSAELFNKGFIAFKASGAKNLVIDLRGNPGGYLDSAVEIASHFLPKDSVIVTEDYKGKQANDVQKSNGSDDVPAGTKVVILIDQGSASASEILSGALQDQHVATLIGTRSFGKGSVQQLIPVDGASLKVTIARWLTPNGSSIMGNGITPDILVTRTAQDVSAGKDPQMERAVQFFSTGK
jgi:carboxyl-terminal processing protease